MARRCWSCTSSILRRKLSTKPSASGRGCARRSSNWTTFSSPWGWNHRAPDPRDDAALQGASTSRVHARSLPGARRENALGCGRAVCASGGTELVATALGTRMTVAQRVAEPELADSAPIVRHRKLAAIGWSQTAERLVAYLERRTPWDS